MNTSAVPDIQDQFIDNKEAGESRWRVSLSLDLRQPHRFTEVAKI
jgi:hypothetical protein